MEEQEMVFREAQEEDMAEILKLVGDIYEKEQGIPREMNPIEAERHPRWWCVQTGSQIIGAIAAWQEETGIQLGRFVIDPEFRGRHLGTALMKYSLDAIFEDGAEFVRGGARDQTMSILRHMGVQQNGDSLMFYGDRITPFILYREKYREN